MELLRTISGAVSSTVSGIWSAARARHWVAVGLGLVIVVAPLAIALVPDTDARTTASDARTLLVGAACLVAAGLMCLHWRVTARTASARFAVLLAVAAVPGLALGGFALAQHDAADAGWPLRLPALAALAACLGFATLRLETLPRWARARLASGLLLLGVASTVGGALEGVADGATALGSAVVGAALLAGTAATLVHLAVEESKERVAELHRRLRAMELGIRADRARLHEIDATVAGIASAQRLMTDGLAADRSDALAAMMRAEVERLQRLIADRAPSRRRSVDLDDVIGQIVLSHLARGRVVVWEPTGLRALGRADDIAEIVNVLLENAAVHGGPDAVSVRVGRDLEGHGITITVADQGPGIAPEVRERVFDWGVSRPGSPGQGIGLHVAADIARELGGRLELLPTTQGAAFALHLPSEPQEVSRDEHVARAS
jgi:signal transduction histidine kinase